MNVLIVATRSRHHMRCMCMRVVPHAEAEAASFKTPAQTNSQEAGEEYQVTTTTYPAALRETVNRRRHKMTGVLCSEPDVSG